MRATAMVGAAVPHMSAGGQLKRETRRWCPICHLCRSYSVINLFDLGDPPSKHRRPSAHNPHLGTYDRDHQQHHVQVEADVQRDRPRADGRGTCPEARRETLCRWKTQIGNQKDRNAGSEPWRLSSLPRGTGAPATDPPTVDEAGLRGAAVCRDLGSCQGAQALSSVGRCCTCSARVSLFFENFP